MELKRWQTKLAVVGGALGILSTLFTAYSASHDRARDDARAEAQLETKVASMYKRVGSLPEDFPDLFEEVHAEASEALILAKAIGTSQEESAERHSQLASRTSSDRNRLAVLESRLEILKRDLCEAQRNLNQVQKGYFTNFCRAGEFIQAEGTCTFSDGKVVLFEAFYDPDQLPCH